MICYLLLFGCGVVLLCCDSEVGWCGLLVVVVLLVVSGRLGLLRLRRCGLVGLIMLVIWLFVMLCCNCALPVGFAV